MSRKKVVAKRKEKIEHRDVIVVYATWRQRLRRLFGSSIFMKTKGVGI